MYVPRYEGRDSEPSQVFFCQSHGPLPEAGDRGDSGAQRRVQKPDFYAHRAEKTQGCRACSHIDDGWRAGVNASEAVDDLSAQKWVSPDS